MTRQSLLLPLFRFLSHSLCLSVCVCVSLSPSSVSLSRCGSSFLSLCFFRCHSLPRTHTTFTLSLSPPPLYFALSLSFCFLLLSFHSLSLSLTLSLYMCTLICKKALSAPANIFICIYIYICLNILSGGVNTTTLCLDGNYLRHGR